MMTTVGFGVILLCHFDMQFSNNEPWRETFSVMKFLYFFMYEMCEIYPLILASGKLVLFQIVIQ